MRLNFPLIGNSNASDRGEETPEGYEHLGRIFVYGNNGIWRQGSNPVDDPTGQIDEVSRDDQAIGCAGIGMPFANRLCEIFPEIEVGLIPCAKGGSSIESWRRYWTRTALYGSALMRILEAEAQGITAGIVGLGGEYETGEHAKAVAWRERFTNVIGDFRVDLGNLSLPVAFARLNNLSHSSDYPYWNTVRVGQDQIRMKNVVMFSTDGVQTQSGNVHYTTTGYDEIGRRAADAIAPLLIASGVVS